MPLRSSLQTDMATCMHKFNTELQGVDSRVSDIETKMAKYATTINDQTDASQKHDDEKDWVKVKLVDIEDRSRRNNLKIRVVPESVQQVDLRKHVQDMFKAILQDLT